MPNKDDNNNVEAEENKYLGTTGIKLKNWMKQKTDLRNIGLWVNGETEKIYKEGKLYLKNYGITQVTPVYGDFVFSNNDKIMKTFFPDARDIGDNPIEFAEKELEIMLDAWRSDEKKQHAIMSIKNFKDKTIRSLDSHIVTKIKAIVEKQ